MSHFFEGTTIPQILTDHLSLRRNPKHWVKLKVMLGKAWLRKMFPRQKSFHLSPNVSVFSIKCYFAMYSILQHDNKWHLAFYYNIGRASLAVLRQQGQFGPNSSQFGRTGGLQLLSGWSDLPVLTNVLSAPRKQHASKFVTVKIWWDLRAVFSLTVSIGHFQIV